MQCSNVISFRKVVFRNILFRCLLSLKIATLMVYPGSFSCHYVKNITMFIVSWSYRAVNYRVKYSFDFITVKTKIFELQICGLKFLFLINPDLKRVKEAKQESLLRKERAAEGNTT